MAKLWQFLQRHPKAAFSEKVQTGDQGKFFKNRPKKSPRLKGPKALWRKWHYPLISMPLNGENWKTLWRKQRLQKCPNGQVMAIFARSPKSRIGVESESGEDLGTNSGSKKGPNGEVMAIFGRSPKTCIFRKSAKGRPRELFQKSPKKYPRFKRPTALWRKCHYPLNCIHL